MDSSFVGLSAKWKMSFFKEKGKSPLKALKFKISTFFFFFQWIVSIHMHVPLSYWTSLSRHKLKGKIIKKVRVEQETKCRATCDCRGLKPTCQPCPHPSGPFSCLSTSKGKPKVASAGQINGVRMLRASTVFQRWSKRFLPSPLQKSLRMLPASY